MKRIAAYLAAGLLLAGYVSGCKEEAISIQDSGDFLARMKYLFQIAETGAALQSERQDIEIPEVENKSLIYTGVLGIRLG